MISDAGTMFGLTLVQEEQENTVEIVYQATPSLLEPVYT